MLLCGQFETARAAPAMEADALYQVTDLLIDENQKPTLISDFKGKPLILTLTYTSCQSACPTTIRTLKNVSRDLLRHKIEANFVIISFDPQIDTPKKLANFKHRWKLPDETWHFLTGDEPKLEKIEKILNFRVVYDKIEEHYDHDKKIYVFDKTGHLKKVFEDWDSDFLKVLSDETNLTPRSSS